MARRSRKIGEILKRWELINDQQVEEGLTIAKAQNRRIGEVLVEMGHISDADVAKALASQFDMEYIDLEEPDVITDEAIKLMPRDLITKYLVLPLGQDNGLIKVLIHDPMDLDTLDNIRFRMNCEIKTALGARSKIKEFVDRLGSASGSSIKDMARDLTQDMRAESLDSGAGSIDIQGLSLDRGDSIDVAAGEDNALADAAQAPIIKLVNKVIADAVEMRASDIHIEPFKDRVRLRYRIDGRCREMEKIPKATQAAVIARLKIMSGMKIQEKRIPQDGRIKLRVGPEIIDFRVSACPVYWGESVVLRILRPDAARIGLENLGMRHDTLETFNRIIKKPTGIFLVTGPTGSGKTTTLYTALDVLNRPDRKIITAEDPVEYNFKGINQCQVRADIGLTFTSILKAMLRQAPNIILVGEIRDLEVADIAIQAALTGHLVFSTLHTNDAPSAITRLIDMGTKPFLVASSIQAVLAQRLVRILCPKCKVEDTEPENRLLRLCGIERSDLVGKTIYKAVGCGSCNNTGYKGRRGIYELMIMNSELRDLAFKRSPVSAIRQAAIAGGMRNLLGDGRLKILDGETTLEEVARLAQVEGVVDIGEEEVAA